MPRKKKEVADGRTDSLVEPASGMGPRDAGTNGGSPDPQPQHVETPGLDLPLDDRRPARRTRSAPARFLSVPRPAKFHEFLEGAEFSSLPDYDRLVLMLLWLLVRKHGGRVPNKPEWIAWRMGIAVDPSQFAGILKGFLKTALITAVGELEWPPVGPKPKRAYKRRAPRTGPSTPARYDPTDLTPSEPEPELSPAELLRRHRDSWGNV